MGNSWAQSYSYWNSNLPQFSGWGNFNNNYIWSWGSFGSSSSRQSNSRMDTQEAREKAQEDYAAKKHALIMKQSELDDLLVEAEKEKQEQIEANFGKGCKVLDLKDGSKQIELSLAEMPAMKKVGRAAGNFFKGIGNIGKKFLGFENGKWNPLKCIRNVAVAAGVAVLCIYAAPIGAAVGKALGSAFIASAISSVPTALCYTGLASGVYMAGKGVKGAVEAETVEEFDKSFQDIGAGTFMAASSVMGLNKISKTAGVASDGFLKNTFVNSWKAGNANLSRATDIMNTLGWDKAGFKAACADAKLAGARLKEREFQEAYDNEISRLNADISRVNQKLSAATSDSEKVFLRMEQEALNKDLTALTNAKTRFDFKAMGTESQEYLNKLKLEAGNQKFNFKDFKHILNSKDEVTIDGYTFKGNELKALQSRINVIDKSLRAHGKALSNISGLKHKAVSSIAGKSFSYMDDAVNIRSGSTSPVGLNGGFYESLRASAVEKFCFADKSFSLSNWFNTQCASLSKVNLISEGSLIAFDPAYAAASYTKGSAYFMPAYFAQSVNPTHDKEAPQIITGSDWDKAMEQYLANVNEIKKAKEDIQKQIDRLG